MQQLQSLYQTFRHPGELLLALLLVLVALHFGLNSFSPLRFDQEKIEIWAFEGQAQVTGLYHYANRSLLPLSFSLGIPFPVDSDHIRPAAFFVSEVDSHGAFLREIKTHSYHGETVFRLWFRPYQAKWIRVEYIQGNTVPNVRYILLTTRKWGQPLGHGEYTLHLGEGLELTSSNYPLNPDVLGRMNTYFFARSDFFPSQDWKFCWRPSVSPETARRNQP